MDNTKICTKCGRELPLSEFNKDKNRKDGLHPWCKECIRELSKTPMGRACSLVCGYNGMDKKHGRGKGNLTGKWVYDNILFKPCAHCGKEGWQVIGCNRLDNSKPHTKDNVEPCCKECNLKLAAKEFIKYNKQFNRFKTT